MKFSLHVGAGGFSKGYHITQTPHTTRAGAFNHQQKENTGLTNERIYSNGKGRIRMFYQENGSIGVIPTGEALNQEKFLTSLNGKFLTIDSAWNLIKSQFLDYKIKE